jgi:hypothetical protein
MVAAATAAVEVVAVEAGRTLPAEAPGCCSCCEMRRHVAAWRVAVAVARG